MNVEHCKLCLKECDAQKSHVIPNAYFKAIRPDGHSLQTHPEPYVKDRYTQDSWAEYLFCRECEQKTAVWEKYVIELLRNPKRKKVISKRGFKTFTLSGIDYKTLKLFQLLILYRAAIATHHVFSKLNLEQEDIETLRDIIRLEIVPEPEKYGCCMVLLWNFEKDEAFTQVIGSPTVWDRKKRKFLIMIFGGFVWEYHVPSLSSKSRNAGNYPKPHGVLTVPVVNFLDYKAVDDMFVTSYRKKALGWGADNKKSRDSGKSTYD